MSKDWKLRWTQTINYLNTKYPCNGLSHKLGDHIQTVIVGDEARKAISKELSLGSRSDGEDDPNFAANSDKRHALRGLLLCQRVYFSAAWAKSSGAPKNVLAPNWKTQSQSHWKSKSESQIDGGIRMFVPDGGDPGSLQAAAHAGPPDGGLLAGNLTIARNSPTAGAAETCYNGIMAWLVKSGLASLRWFTTEMSPNNQGPCEKLFGKGELVWDQKVFKDDMTPPVIEKGYIIHMWNPANYNWNGHWVVNNGDGTVCGVNNGELSLKKDGEQVLKKYTNTATLKGQFLGYGGIICKQVPKGNGFLEEVPLHNPPQYHKPCMVKIDPRKVPNLM